MRWFKWWYQRAKRGYANCDVWSLDWYLNSWLPQAIRQLKNSGYPADLTPQKWNDVLERIALGFESADRINKMANWGDNNSDIAKSLDEKDFKLFKYGMGLFAKYYMSLWN